MRIFTYLSLALILQCSETTDNVSSVQPCILSVDKYKYTSQATFHHLPTEMVEQTMLQITADVLYYQSKSSCHSSFIQVANFTVNNVINGTNSKDIEQLEKAILQIFIEVSAILHNKTEEILLTPSFVNYTKKDGRISTVRIDKDRTAGNLFARSLLSKLLPATTTTCETLVDMDEFRLKTSTCVLTTAGLLALRRQISFDCTLEDSHAAIELQKSASVKKSKDDFDLLLSEICTRGEWAASDPLINMIHHELDDDDLNEILLSDPASYSHCQWSIINETIITVARRPATEFLFRNFLDDPSVLEQHLNRIEKPLSQQTRDILSRYLNHSKTCSEFTTLRVLLLLDGEQSMWEYGLNRSHRLDYRAIALRSLKNTDEFHEKLRAMFEDEDESYEIRLIALQAIVPLLNSSDIAHWIETVESKQISFYLNSLLKQSSIWEGHSGSYVLPFGTINVIFDEHIPSFMPNIAQIELEGGTGIDLYWIRKNNSPNELLLFLDRTMVIRFSTFKGFLTWLSSDRRVEIDTLDGFSLTMDLKVRRLKDYLHQWKYLLKKSTAGVAVQIQHGFGQIRTGYAMSLDCDSDFKVNVTDDQHATSYGWHAKQKENSLFRIQQSLRPLIFDSDEPINNYTSSSPPKDFCYVIPHFDSKLCLSFVFERLWSSSVAVRLLSDDPSLVYKFIVTNHSVHFNIQQDEQIFRSYSLLRKYHEHPWMPYYVELSTPTHNYSSILSWQNSNLISYRLFNNEDLISNGSGLFQYGPSSGFSVNLTEIYPKHMGQMDIGCDGNLSIHARECLGGEWRIRLERLPDWRDVRLDVKVIQTFLFFKEDFHFHLHYALHPRSFNLNWTKDDRSIVRCAFAHGDAHLNHLLQINTSLIEFDYHTRVSCVDPANVSFQSSAVVNGWSFWQINLNANNFSEVQMQVNRLRLHAQIEYPTIQLTVNYSSQKLFRSYFRVNESKTILLSIETSKLYYRTEGRLSTNYTNFTLDLPIVDQDEKQSHCLITFLADGTSLTFNLTSDHRQEYFLQLFHRFTFAHRYLAQSHTSILLEMMHYPLFVCNSSMEFEENSTVLQSWNGSMHLPPLFVSKPFVLVYKRHAPWFIQFFHWANLTRTWNRTELITPFGLKASMTNDVLKRISLRLEQVLLDKRLLFLFEIDRHWILSLVVNNRTRYELTFFSSESSVRLKHIDLGRNQVRQLTLNYSTDNETFFRTEIAFSKYFSAFINDFIVELSMKNHTLKFLCHIPLFRREFLSLTWKRHLHRDLFHFQGAIQMNLLRRRRIFDYDYQWNLASMALWTMKSRLAMFSLDPIEWTLDLNNDYLWSGKWVVDFRLILAARRELIRLHHEYHYHHLVSKILFDVILMNKRYDLALNYSHLNHSIRGQFIDNNGQHQIDGAWNSTDNLLLLNTQDMTSRTTITSNSIRTIVHQRLQKLGILIERSNDRFTQDTEILQCHPYFILQSRPRLLALHYYTLNDGLTSTMYEWSKDSYVSWNYTGHGRTIIPIRKFEMDARTNYLFRLHTTTFKYSSMYNFEKGQFIVRRTPVAENADDRFEFKSRYFTNRTFLLHLQVINNHYEIIGQPEQEDFSWQLHGYFRRDSLNGSLVILPSDWWSSSRLDINSSLYISTGRHVQLLPHQDPQLAVEVLLKNRFRIAFQYAGLQSLVALKVVHRSSNIDFVFSSRAINETLFNLRCQINDLINQSWILLVQDGRYQLYDHQGEFSFNGSLTELSFQHTLDDRRNILIYNEDSIELMTNEFGFLLSNRSSETSRYIHIYHRKQKQNLTIQYFSSGQFSFDNLKVQTPIYDINLIYYPTDEEHRYVKVILEFLPLQMSAFSLVRGRSFRIGYQTSSKEWMLSGNLAFSVEDFDRRQIITMDERWKLSYGLEKREKIYLKWNVRINSAIQSFQGRVTIQDPNDELSTPVYSDVQGHIADQMIIVTLRTSYSPSENQSQSILLRVNIDQRLLRQQYIAVDLIHESSATNLSFTIDRYPQRRLRITLKPNGSVEPKTLLHLYANTTESQVKLLLIVAEFIHVNLTLPKSYPQTGVLHSALFMNDEEYYDGYLETSALHLRTKDHYLNISMGQLSLQERSTGQLVASIVARWIDRNSSTALITFLQPGAFSRKFLFNEQHTQEPTWLQRFKQALVNNSLASGFGQDLHRFFQELETDFFRDRGVFEQRFVKALRFDEDLQLSISQFNSSARAVLDTLFQIGFCAEDLLQDYMNNLTCLQHHRNLLHLNFPEFAKFAIDSLVYQLISQINRTSVILQHFTRYPRSISAVLSYLTNDILLDLHQDAAQVYLESKQFLLDAALRSSNNIELFMSVSPIFFDSITLLSSKDIRTIVWLFNNRLRRLITVWKNSPMEYKLMKTAASALIDSIERLRGFLDDRFDFLLPRLEVFTPRIVINGTINQTYLLTWSKAQN